MKPKTIYCTSCKYSGTTDQKLTNEGTAVCPQCGFEGKLIKKTNEPYYILYTPKLKGDMVRVALNRDEWALVCDAIDIAKEKDTKDKNDRFWHMEDILEELETEIEKQSGCQTRED